MTRLRSAALAAACLCFGAFPAVAAAPDAVPDEVRELQRKALDDHRAYDTLRDLTGRVGNRLAGSAGDAKAVEWALATLRAQGFQNVHAEPVTVPHWVRGNATVQIVGTPAVDLTALALGGSVGTDGRTIEGDVVAATNVKELQGLSRTDVAGKIVFLYARMLETRNGMDYGPTVDNRVDGAIEAAKLGAAAVVIRAVGSEDADRPHTGSMHYANGVPRIPAFAIGNTSADRLLDRVARGPVRLRLSSTSRCEGTAQSANVIGEIPGRKAGSTPGGDQYVVLGAHLDSWDVGTGAQDDGAGVVTVVEAARRIAEMQPRPLRTIRVVLFANEESGQSGARRYVIDHEAELGRHAAALEADLGSGRVFRFESGVKSADLPSVLGIADLLAPLGVPFTSNDTGGGADIGPMHAQGVPVFGLQHDASKYFEIHHTDADRIDRVNPADLAFNVAAYATVAWALSEQPTAFTRLDRTWPTVDTGVQACEWQP
jgi:carboxypeptidase Q